MKNEIIKYFNFIAKNRLQDINFIYNQNWYSDLNFILALSYFKEVNFIQELSFSNFKRVYFLRKIRKRFILDYF